MRVCKLFCTDTHNCKHEVVTQIYSLGVVMHLGIQGTAAALVPSARAMGGAQGDEAARKIADRIFSWGTLLGVILALVQLVASEWLLSWDLQRYILTILL